MKRLPLLWASLILAACALRADGQEAPKLPDVSRAAASPADPALARASDRIYAQLQPLFRKYYPDAVASDPRTRGISFEHEVTTFEFPYTGPPKVKHQATTQRGPKQGGIECHVSVEKGPYRGQLAASTKGSTLGLTVVDKKVYKTMLMAPYSAREDVHLWARLSYPPDASDEFLKEYRAIMAGFERDGGVAGAERPAEQGSDVLEGTLRVHPKFHFRYYIDGFGIGQTCALFQANDRLARIEPGSLVRVRGDLASKYFGAGKNDPTPALVSTWVIYMNVADVEVLRKPETPRQVPPPVAGR